MWSFNIRDWIILFVCALWVVVCSYAQTPIIGVDIGTEHFYSRQLNGTNPGLYIMYKDWVVGDYYNSYKKNTTWVGYNLHTDDPLSLIVGGATGYYKKCPMCTTQITPMIVPTYKFGNGIRLSIPNLQGIHLSYEWK